jgi:hypothetical protein
MSGIEPIIAAEAAAATTAAATTATNVAAATAAEIAAAEAAAAAAAEAAGTAAATEAATVAAAEAGTAATAEAALAETAKQTALEQFGSSAGEGLLSAEMTPQQYMAQELERASALNSFGVSTDAMLQQDLINQQLAQQKALEGYGQSASEILANQTPTFQDAAWQNMLRQGMDADMPGATMRSIQAGFQNAPLNTIRSLPQYLGFPAPPPGAKEALQMARLVSPQQQGGTRTSVSPPMLNRGKEVSLAAPVYGLLGGAPMPKRRRLSLI